jgi:hypothetical protein
LNRTAVYQEQAAYCAYLLHRVVDPRRRALIERERQDWLMLAYQTDLWSEIDTDLAVAPQQRTFAPAKRRFEVQEN